MTNANRLTISSTGGGGGGVGLNGTNGLNGANGLPGATGPQGIQGIQGVAGSDGGPTVSNGVVDFAVGLTSNATNTLRTYVDTQDILLSGLANSGNTSVSNGLSARIIATNTSLLLDLTSATNNLDAAKITVGTVPAARLANIPTNSIDATFRNWVLDQSSAGISSATATNIAKYQSQISTNELNTVLRAYAAPKTNAILYVSNGTISLNTVARELLDTSEVPSVRYSARAMLDPGQIVSIDWGGRALYDSSSQSPLNWQSRTILPGWVGDGNGWTNLNAAKITTGTVAPARLGSGTANSGTVLFGNGVWGPTNILGGGGSGGISATNPILYANAFKFLDAALYRLYDSSGIQAVDTGSRLLYNNAGTATANWQSKTLSPGWIADASGFTNFPTGLALTTNAILHSTQGAQTKAVDVYNRTLFDQAGFTAAYWGSRGLTDAAGTPSVEWGLRWLEASNEVTTLDWQNKFFSAGWVGDASGFTNLDATHLTGFIPDARLNSTIARDAEFIAADTIVSNGVVAFGVGANTTVSNGVVTFAVSAITSATNNLDGAKVTVGIVPANHLGSGTPTANTVLYGNGTWGPTNILGGGGGGGSLTVSNGLILWNGVVTNLISTILQKPAGGALTNGAIGTVLTSANAGGQVFWDYPQFTAFTANLNAGGFSITGLGSLSLTGALTAPVLYATNIFGDASGLTNLLADGIVAPTNLMSGTTIDFAHHESSITLSGNLTISALSGIVATNYNWTIIHVLPGGADRMFTPPSGFRKNWSGTTCTITNGTVSDFLAEVQLGSYSNIFKLDAY